MAIDPHELLAKFDAGEVVHLNSSRNLRPFENLVVKHYLPPYDELYAHEIAAIRSAWQVERGDLSDYLKPRGYNGRLTNVTVQNRPKDTKDLIASNHVKPKTRTYLAGKSVVGMTINADIESTNHDVVGCVEIPVLYHLRAAKVARTMGSLWVRVVGDLVENTNVSDILARSHRTGYTDFKGSTGWRTSNRSSRLD